MVGSRSVLTHLRGVINQHITAGPFSCGTPRLPLSRHLQVLLWLMVLVPTRRKQEERLFYFYLFNSIYHLLPFTITTYSYLLSLSIYLPGMETMANV